MQDIEYFLAKAMKYCSTREVCVNDIRQKLLSWNVDENFIDSIIEKLTAENFVNDKRFAQAFASDKFRFNKWGKQKIRHSLVAKKISEENIQIALENIDSSIYFNTASELIENKLKSIKDKDLLKTKQKIFNFMHNKGYETDIIFSILEKKIKNS